MSMILAETCIFRATQEGRLRTGEAQGNLCRPSFQAGFSGAYALARSHCAALKTYTTRRVAISVAETGLQLSLPEHGFRHMGGVLLLQRNQPRLLAASDEAHSHHRTLAHNVQ